MCCPSMTVILNNLPIEKNMKKTQDLKINSRSTAASAYEQTFQIVGCVDFRLLNRDW